MRYQRLCLGINECSLPAWEKALSPRIQQSSRGERFQPRSKMDGPSLTRGCCAIKTSLFTVPPGSASVRCLLTPRPPPASSPSGKRPASHQDEHYQRKKTIQTDKKKKKSRLPTGQDAFCISSTPSQFILTQEDGELSPLSTSDLGARLAGAPCPRPHQSHPLT